MNRIIKFRAWDGQNMYFNHSVCMQIDGTVSFLSRQGEWVETNELKIMQFTGLTDKNGVGIFEGDIVKFHYFYVTLGANLGVEEAEHSLTGVIIWGDFGWGVDAIKGEHWQGYTGYDAGEGECDMLNLMSMNESSIHEESFEIIGNIHQHPHLLTS